MKMTAHPIFALALVFCGAAASVSFGQEDHPLLTTGNSIGSTMMATDPVRVELQTTPVEKDLMNQMEGVVASSKASGSLNVNAMRQVFNDAYTAKVQPEVIGQMVKNAVVEFPDSIHDTVVSSLAPANMTPSKEVVYEVANSAIMYSPRPFAHVSPVGDSVSQMFDESKVSGMSQYLNYALSRIASSCPCNPMSPTAYDQDGYGTEKEGMGHALKQRMDDASTLANLFLQNDVGINRFYMVPGETSSPAGVVEQQAEVAPPVVAP